MHWVLMHWARCCICSPVQVSAAKEEAHARERDLRALGQEKAAVAADAVAAAEERLAQALEVRGDRVKRSLHSHVKCQGNA